MLTGCPVTVTRSNASATREPGEPTVGNSSVWWCWTAPTSGIITVTVISSQQRFEPFVGIYSGTALTNLVPLAENSRYGYDDYTAQVTLHVVSGSAYYIAVTAVFDRGGNYILRLVPTAPPEVVITCPTKNSTFYVGDTVVIAANATDSDGVATNLELYLDDTLVQRTTNPSCQVSITFTNTGWHEVWAQATNNAGLPSIPAWISFSVNYPPPSNDNFTNAFVLTGCPVTVTGSNLGATLEPGEPTEGYSSVWWSWTAPTSGVVTVTVTAVPLYWFLPFVGVYVGTALTNLTPLAEASDYIDYIGQVTLNVTDGSTYYIAVRGLWGDGDFSLRLVPTTPPTVAITSPTNNGIYYVGDAIVITADASDSDGTVTNVELYLNGELIQRTTNHSCEVNVTFTNGVWPSVWHPLWARATDNDGVTSISTRIDFHVIYPPPLNDNFTNAIVLTGCPVTTTGNNLGATLEPREQTVGDNSVWWSWTAPTSGVFTVTAVNWPNSPFWPQPFVGVYAGTALTNLVALAENSSYDDYTGQVTLNVVSGSTYHIAVTAGSGIVGDFSLRLVPTTPPTVAIATPANDSTRYVGDTVVIAANAADLDGVVTNLEIYLDYELIQQTTNQPYQVSVIFTNSFASWHAVWARATDNDGVSSVSERIVFLVTYPPPLNDNFTNATILNNRVETVMGNNEYATREPGEPTLGDQSVWWSWTAPTSGVYVVTAVSLSGFSPFVGVYAGTNLNSLTRLATNGDYYSDVARAIITAVSGATYRIAVTTVGGMGGDFTLSLIPANLAEWPARFSDVAGLSDGTYRLCFFTGMTNDWVVQASTDFLDWETLGISCPPGCWLEYDDYQATLFPSRFYRLKAIP